MQNPKRVKDHAIEIFGGAVPQVEGRTSVIDFEILVWMARRPLWPKLNEQRESYRKQQMGSVYCVHTEC